MAGKLVIGPDSTLTLDGRPGRFVWVYDDEPQTIVTGDAFTEDSPRDRQRRAAQLVSAALDSTASSKR